MQVKQQPAPEVTTAQRIEASMAVLRNILPGLSQGSLQELLEKALHASRMSDLLIHECQAVCRSSSSQLQR